MTDTHDATYLSPVPEPALDAVAPEPFRGIYGMPMFATIPCDDLDASVDFWVGGVGFFELFSVPGQLVHLRRWAFQDVLLVPAATAVTDPPALTVSFACVLGEIEEIAERCERARPGSTNGPRHTPWNSVDLEITTPERARIIMTAGKPLEPESAEARNLREMGIAPPQ